MSKIPADIKLAIVHHPLGWLNNEEVSNVKGMLRQSVDCILSGHLHETDVESVAGVVSSSLHLTAGATYQSREWPNTAMFCTFRSGMLKVCPIRYNDKPREIWTIDPGIYPDSEDFTHEFDLTSSIATGKVETQSVNAGNAVDVRTLRHAGESSTDQYQDSTHASSDSRMQAAKKELEQDLFVSPSGNHLYANPRLMTKPQEYQLETDMDGERINLDQIVSSNDSYMIETRSEYGGSTLCKRLVVEFISSGFESVFLKDARDLPNYRKKLESEFPSEVRACKKPTELV